MNKDNNWSKKEEKQWWDNHRAYQAPEVRGNLEQGWCSKTANEINKQNNFSNKTTEKKQINFKRNI